VTAGSALTWSVINAAGDQVLSSDKVIPALPAVSRATGHGSGRPAPDDRNRGRDSPQLPPPAATRPTVPVPLTEGTWQGAGGAVLAGCRGSRIDLRSATPDDGYRVEVASRGPREIEVAFESESYGQTLVRAVCTRGAPSFREQHGPSDD
jgi:hypothetical protein